MSYLVALVVVVGVGLCGSVLGTLLGVSAPWWAWSILAAAVTGLAWYRSVAKAIDARLEAQTEARDELQFWEFRYRAEDYSQSESIHFPSLLMREHNVSFGDESLRLYAVRRRADGVWERRLNDGAPILTNRRVERILNSLDPDDHSRDKEFDAEVTAWQAFGDGTVEMAYQRFIHAQDVTVKDSINEKWTKEAEEFEEKAQARDAKFRDAVAQPT
jgi:hypothetical protein